MMRYLLDTNAFWLVLQTWNQQERPATLPTDLWQDGECVFSISEITAMEIYSTLGQYLKKNPAQIHTCDRILSDGSKCQNKWEKPAVKRISHKDGQYIELLIRRILLQKEANFNVTIVPVNSAIIAAASSLLQLHAAENSLHSLDSIVAATTQTGGFTAVTFDRKLKNVLRLANIAVFEPVFQ